MTNKLSKKLIDKINYAILNVSSTNEIFIDITNCIEKKLKISRNCISYADVLVNGIKENWSRVKMIKIVEFTRNYNTLKFPLEKITFSRSGELIANPKISLYKNNVCIYKNSKKFLLKIRDFNHARGIGLKNIECKLTFLDTNFLDKIHFHDDPYKVRVENNEKIYDNLPKDLYFPKSPNGDISLEFLPIFYEDKPLKNLYEINSKYKLVIEYDEIYIDSDNLHDFKIITGENLNKLFPPYIFKTIIRNKHYNYFQGYFQDDSLLLDYIGDRPIINVRLGDI